jgi:hypothetical protein
LDAGFFQSQYPIVLCRTCIKELEIQALYFPEQHFALEDKN